MPTGYTAALMKGEVTDFRTFALRCARNFGALITMRDEPMDAEIPERLEPSDFYRESVEEWADRVKELAAMTPEQAAEAATQDHEERLAQWSERRQERADIHKRYEGMLEHVHAWEPPTGDHVRMKDFMIEQIRESMKYDCGEWEGDEPERKSGPAWLNDELRNARSRLARAEESLTEELERVQARNEWLDALRESLPESEAVTA